MKRIVRAAANSWNGLRFALASEAAFRQEAAALAVAVPAAFLIAEDFALRALLVAAVLLVLVAELVNTAIEKLADRVTREHDPQIGHVKDLGSAAVALAMAVAGLLWLSALAARLGVI